MNSVSFSDYYKTLGSDRFGDTQALEIISFQGLPTNGLSLRMTVPELVERKPLNLVAPSLNFGSAWSVRLCGALLLLAIPCTTPQYDHNKTETLSRTKLKEN